MPSAAEVEIVMAQLNMKLQPIERGEYFEDPLQEKLEEAGVGAVTGGGTMLAESNEIDWCDLEIEVNRVSESVLALLMATLESLDAPKGSKLILPSGEERPFGKSEGLAVYLNGTELPKEVYENSDAGYVIEECERLLGEAGKYFGAWDGPVETGLYFYGAEFAKMREAIAPVLASYPLCQKARVVQIA